MIARFLWQPPVILTLLIYWLHEFRINVKMKENALAWDTSKWSEGGYLKIRRSQNYMRYHRRACNFIFKMIFFRRCSEKSECSMFIFFKTNNNETRMVLVNVVLMSSLLTLTIFNSFRDVFCALPNIYQR